MTPVEAAKFLMNFTHRVIDDSITRNKHINRARLIDAIALLECAALLGDAPTVPAPAPPPTDAGQWAKALQTEHMHRSRGMVHAMTLADIVAFEDAEKAAQAAQAGAQVDTRA